MSRRRDWEELPINKVTYDERIRVYTNALVHYGTDKQCVVAVEELSECQKEICKVLRGKGNLENLAEEIADATICLEQLRYFFGINDQVCDAMDKKIQRLDRNLRDEQWGVNHE